MAGAVLCARRGKISEANGKSFAKAYSTNIVEGTEHSWNPGLVVDVSWNGGPIGKLMQQNPRNLRRPS